MHQHVYNEYHKNILSEKKVAEQYAQFGNIHRISNM